MPINQTRFIKKIVNVNKSISYLINQIEDGNEFLIGNLSVELRKLLNAKKGDNLMQRLEENLGIKFQLLANIDHPFLKPKQIGIDEFKNQLIFAMNGRPVTRMELINMVADQEGAHLDQREDPMISISESVVFAVGSQGKLKKPLSQKSLFIVESAKVLKMLLDNHLPRL